MAVAPHPAACETCGEPPFATEPCACVRGRPAPLSEGTSAACGDSQHYACAGYVLEVSAGLEVWLRCPCTCHAAVAPAPLDAA
jgi:hypothetical protein